MMMLRCWGSTLYPSLLSFNWAHVAAHTNTLMSRLTFTRSLYCTVASSTAMKWRLSHFQLSSAATVCGYLVLGHDVCIILILGSVSWIRHPLLARLPHYITPDGLTDGHSNVLLVHQLSRQPARHASVYHFSGAPKLDFYLPANHRVVVTLHMRNNKTERCRVHCDTQQISDSHNTVHTTHKWILFCLEGYAWDAC